MTSNTQSDTDQWTLLLRDELTESDRATLLGTMAESINSALEERAEVRNDITSALRAILDTQRYDDRTWSAVDNSLTICLGEWASRLVAWLVANADYATRLAEIRPNLKAPALAFLQGLLARYGSDLERAFYMTNGFVDDWRSLWRDLWTDPSTNQYRLRLRILKYSGEDVLLESGPDAMLALATQLLTILNAIPVTNAFSQDPEPFLSEARQLVSTLTPAPAEPSEQPTPVSSGSVTDTSGESKPDGRS
jgi:hypothetical protein